MADPSTSSSSMWAFMLSWLTPTSLFLFVNLTIATIVLSHRFNRKPQQHQHDQLGLFGSPQLVRTPSLLERVRSINFSHYNFQPVDPEPQQYPTPDNSTGLVRTPSFLERVRSINFSHYNFQQPDPEPQHVTQYPTPDNSTGLVRTPSFLERVRSIDFSHYNFQQINPEPQHVTQYPTPDNSTGLVRTPSLLARLKSMDFSSLYRPDQESKDVHPTGSHDPNPRHEHLVHRSKSDTGSGASENRPEKVMKKSASEKSALGGFEDEDEEVDAKADDFINRFKQQLKLQRLDSLLRYREMLKRN